MTKGNCILCGQSGEAYYAGDTKGLPEHWLCEECFDKYVYNQDTAVSPEEMIAMIKKVQSKKEYIKPNVSKNDPLMDITF